MSLRDYGAGVQPIAVDALSPTVRRYASKPYKANAEIAHRYHLGAYQSWCSNRGLQPFPLDVERILAFASDRAAQCAFFTVREDVRVVCLEYRRRTTIDIYCDTRVARFLSGLRRVAPPRPVLPLKPSDFERILEHRIGTWKTRRSRVMAMLIWAAGFTTSEIVALDVEMLRFDDRGATVKFGHMVDRRETVRIGRAQDAARCPVAALESLITERAILGGPVFNHRLRSKPEALRFRQPAISLALRLLRRQVGLNGQLSVERIRRGGLIAQAQNVDLVTLCHYHGFRCIEHLAKYLGEHVEAHRKFGYRSHRPSGGMN